MLTVSIEQNGGVEELHVGPALTKPIPKQREILIRIHATSVNPVDAKIRSGALSMLPCKFPLVLGWDLSRVVEEVGAGVLAFKPGDEVIAFPPVLGGQGTYATHIVMPENIVALKPTTIDHTTAAALPMTGLTANQALFRHGLLQAGQRVFILGASGGVGAMAVQLAKRAGAYVIVSASTKNLSFLRELGAQEVVDYTNNNFDDHVDSVDLVLDCVGGQSQINSVRLLKKGGHLVSIVEIEKETLALLDKEGKAGNNFLTAQSGQELAGLANLVDEGHLNPIISQVLSINEVRKAHRSIETGHTRGKIVLKIIDETFELVA